MSEQGSSERDQLIARAQELGIGAPWFRSSDDLRELIAGTSHQTAAIPFQPAADIAVPLAADDPRAGTPDDPGVVDPYAHLRAAPEAEDEEGGGA